MKRFLIGCLALLLVFSSWPAIGMAASQFPDIKGHFAEKEILQLYEQGVISGYKDGRFYPNRQVTRAEFLRMLLETVPVKEWIKGPVPFEQLSKHWAYHYLENSYRSGLLLEMEWKLVDPKLEEKMTRAEAALLLAAAMDLKASTTIVNPFKDLDKSLEKVTEAILALNQIGIIRGMTDDTYGPDQQLTRGQVSKILILVQQFKERQLEQRLNPQVALEEIKGDVKVVTAQSSRAGKVGEVLSVGTEIQTGAQSSATLKISDGDTLYIDANSRLTIQELDIALQDDKSGHVQAQQFKILEETILLRGKADEKNIGLNWQTDKKVNDYSIFKARNETVDPSRKPTVKGSKSTKWLDTDIEPGHIYHYQVVGATGPNEGLGSKEISFEVVKKASFKLWSGNVLAKVKSLFSPSSKFEVQTPTTTAGVRGTTFSVSVQQDGTSGVGVYSGSVALGDSNSSSINGQAQVTLQSLQQATVAKPGNAPDVKELKVSETSSFIQESLAKVIVQEKQEQQQVQDKLKELEKKLQEKLGAVNNQTVITPPELPPVETQKSTQETNDLNKVYQQNQSQIDKIVENNYQAPSAPAPSTGGGGGGSSSSPTIASIPLQYYRVGQGDSFSLPTTVPVKMSDGTTSQLSVKTWSPAHADTSQPGIYTFFGTVSGHTATFKLAVEAPLGTPVAVETNKPLAFAGGITLDLGSTSIPPGVKVTVSESTSTTSLPTGFQVGGKIISFSFNPSINSYLTTTEPVRISIPVNSTADIEKTAIYYDNGSEWIYQPTVYENGLLYATVSHFSTYGVLKDTIPPSIPTVHEINNSGAVILNLSAVDHSGIKKYLIYRNELLLGETESNLYTDAAVVGGQTFTYKIKAVDNLGNTSDFSSAINVDVVSGYRYDTAPSWSGNRIAFAGQIDVVSSYNIYTMGSDGSNLQLVVANGMAPALSANGERIAFIRANNLFVANVEGTNVQQLTSTSDVEYHDSVYQSSPAWTSDGSYLYFASVNGIEKMNISTLNRQVIIPTPYGYTLKSPAISPDGSKLAYESISYSGTSQQNEIYLKDLSLGTSKKLADGMEPAFSKDGTKISFTTYTKFSDYATNHIVIMNLDGSKRISVSRNLSNVQDRGHYHHSTWSADDTKIAVHTDMHIQPTDTLPMGQHIFIMDLESISPAVPTIDQNLSHIHLTNQNQYEVSGTGEIGAIVDVTLTDSAGTKQTAQGMINNHGRYDVTVATTNLHSGIITVSVTQTDGIYNRKSPESTRVVIKDVESPLPGNLSVLDNSSLQILLNSSPNSYTSSENNSYASNSVGALMFSFSEPIRKSSIEDVGLYINGAVASDTIKYMLLSEFDAGNENQIGTNQILMTYSQLKQAVISASGSAAGNPTLQFVFKDIVGNPCTIDLVIQ